MTKDQGRVAMVPILGLENDVVSPANCNAMLQTTIYRSSSPMQMVFRDDTIFALGYLGVNILHIQLPLVFQPGGYYVRFELSMSGDLLSVFEFRWTPESMTEDLLSRCCASSEPDVPDLIKHLTHCSKVCLAPFEQEQMANFIDNVQPLDFDGRGSRKQTIREHSTFISKMHAISKCQFGLLTGMECLLTGSTRQKFLSTGPHPVYSLKPYRYRTQSCQQATLSC